MDEGEGAGFVDLGREIGCVAAGGGAVGAVVLVLVGLIGGIRQGDDVEDICGDVGAERFGVVAGGAGLDRGWCARAVAVREFVADGERVEEGGGGGGWLIAFFEGAAEEVPETVVAGEVLHARFEEGSGLFPEILVAEGVGEGFELTGVEGDGGGELFESCHALGFVAAGEVDAGDALADLA